MPMFKVRVMATMTLDRVFDVDSESMEDALDEVAELAEDPKNWDFAADGGDIEIVDTEPAED